MVLSREKQLLKLEKELVIGLDILVKNITKSRKDKDKARENRLIDRGALVFRELENTRKKLNTISRNKKNTEFKRRIKNK